MLIYSKEPLNVMMKNILLLDDPFTDGYVYISKETYDQALSLHVTFNEDIGRVKATISGKGMLNWAANKVIGHVVSLCAEKFASPINMLAPYLAYTLPLGVEWPEDDTETIRMAYGVLHQMSQFINFYATALMPAGAKADITIPKNIIMAYEDSWRAQLETLDKCVVTIPIYVNGNNTQSSVGLKEMLADPYIERAVNDNSIEVPDFVENEEQPVAAEQDKEEEHDEQITEQSEVVNAEGEGSAAEDPESSSEKEVEETGEEDEEDGDEDGEEDDMEAKILALMKSIEEAPAENFIKKDTKSEQDSTPAATPANETVKQEETKSDSYGKSGSINMTEEQIAAGNRKILNDYDI